MKELKTLIDTEVGLSSLEIKTGSLSIDLQ